jgi:Protein of unknown function (DUF1573)
MRRKAAITMAVVAIMASNCNSGPGNNSAGSVSDESNGGKSEIAFREYQHDFGKLTEGEKVSYTFTFDNKGTTNLILSLATTTCGCTVPKYDSKPIPPGAIGSLEVVFDTSGKSGMQTKTITVKSNAKTPVVLLKITAEVTTTNNN